MSEYAYTTNRGFRGYTQLVSADGMTVEVQESSAAFVQRCWLRLKGKGLVIGENEPLAGSEHGLALSLMRATLAAEQARSVADGLKRWLSELRAGEVTSGYVTDAEDEEDEDNVVEPVPGGADSLLRIRTTYGDIVELRAADRNRLVLILEGKGFLDEPGEIDQLAQMSISSHLSSRQAQAIIDTIDRSAGTL